jgi:Xaa-Pro aminopeptidase
MFDKLTYIHRRVQLKQYVESGIILLLGNQESSMNYKDNWYPFRQDSSFLYFTGLDKPNLALIIDIDQDQEILFGDNLTVDDIIWNGRQKTIEEQAALCGISTVQPIRSLEGTIKKNASNRKVHFIPPYRPEHYLQLNGFLGIPPALLHQEASIPLIKAIVALRSIKSEEEIDEIEKAVTITSKMQAAAMHYARAGMTEAEIAGKVHGVAISAGGHLSFPTILTVHGEILHNHFGLHILQQGGMVLCDCGAETSMHYAGDLTRTFPVNESFSSLQKEIYNIVLSAQETAAEATTPGKLFRDIHFLACEQLVEGLKQLGLMKGDAKEAVAAGAHTLFFQCGLGHMMGLDVHDMENLGESYVGYTEDLKKSTEFGLRSLRLGRALEAGFVLTVEPGLYFIPELIDIWTAEKKHAQFINYSKVQDFKTFGGIRIEDDYVITPTGNRLLGKPLNKTADFVESARSAKREKPQVANM